MNDNQYYAKSEREDGTRELLRDHLTNKKHSINYQAVIEVINGHHDGLVGYQYLELFLKNSLQNIDPVECNNRKTAALAGQKQYQEATEAFRKDFPQFKSEGISIEKLQRRIKKVSERF